MKQIRIEKRLPYGFKGGWGKVYKLYTQEEKSATAVIEWQKSYYADIGQDVQFKCVADKEINETQFLKNLANISESRVLETTDTYFDEEIGEYMCVVSIGDILFYEGKYYVVDKMTGKNTFTPKEQYFWYISCKKIFDKIITY